MQVANEFYFWQSITCVSWWAVIYFLYRKPLTGLCHGSACSRPWYIPRGLLRLLHSWKAVVFPAMPLALFIAWLCNGHVAGRLFAAIAVSLYHLTETSVTNRHGEYPLLYTSWALLFTERLGPDYEAAAALGVVIHFCLAAGVSKLWIGGREWLQPATMKAYLSAYRDSSSPPISRAAATWAIDHAAVLSLISLVTIVVEVVLVPATLLLPAHCRVFGALGMLAMHVGIAVFMSYRVALVFFTVLPCYFIGFLALDVPIASPPWFVAASIGLLPSLLPLALLRRQLPESWPISPISLFMWSGSQAAPLLRSLMKEDTRVVLTTAAGTAHNIVGATIVHHLIAVPAAIAVSASQDIVHDSVLRVIGLTLVHDELRESVLARTPDGQWDIACFVRSLQSWLHRRRRIFQLSTGEDLTKAFFVRMQNGRVQEVLISDKSRVE